MSDTVKTLGQYPTPVWVAEALVARHFDHLTSSDFVIEPSCGPGSFLMALPSHIPAVGVDIDPHMAARARANSGREVLVGDFQTVQIDARPTAIVGNPPFNLSVIDGFLHRSHAMLPEGGKVGMILPAYAFQTAGRVSEYAERWSIMQEMIPRNIFSGLSLPLVFALFSKDRRRKLIGFALYHELADLQKINKPYRDIVGEISGSVWKKVVVHAMLALGRVRVDLKDIYKVVEGQRPTKTKWWREQIRKVLRESRDMFQAEGQGVYSLIAT